MPGLMRADPATFGTLYFDERDFTARQYHDAVEKTAAAKRRGLDAQPAKTIDAVHKFTLDRAFLYRHLTLVGVVVSGLTSLACMHPARPTEQHPPRVAMPVEPVSSTPKSDRLSLFDRRWDTMPTVAEIRTIPLEKPAPPKPPLIRPEGKDPEPDPDPEPKRHHRQEREHRHRDVCERHHMHKEYTRGGKSWRCRR